MLESSIDESYATDSDTIIQNAYALLRHIETHALHQGLHTSEVLGITSLSMALLLIRMAKDQKDFVELSAFFHEQIEATCSWWYDDMQSKLHLRLLRHKDRA